MSWSALASVQRVVPRSLVPFMTARIICTRQLMHDSDIYYRKVCKFELCAVLDISLQAHHGHGRMARPPTQPHRGHRSHAPTASSKDDQAPKLSAELVKAGRPLVSAHCARPDA